MAKGISLDQFKSQLDTDAQKRCIAQENTIKELHSQVKQLRQLLEDRNIEIAALQNRCFVFQRGLLCGNCMIKNCSHN